MHPRPARIVKQGGFSPGEAAEDLGVASSVIRAAIERGDLPQQADGRITAADLGSWFSAYSLDHPEVLDR